MIDFHSLMFFNVSLIFNHIKATNVDVLFKFMYLKTAHYQLRPLVGTLYFHLKYYAHAFYIVTVIT